MKNEIAQKLSAGKHAWNEWRKANSYLNGILESSFFNGSDYSGYDFSYCDLSQAELRNKNFSNADFTGSVMNDADFAGSNFSGATLKGTRMNRGHVNLANFSGTKFIRSRISNCSTVQCNFQQARMFGAEFQQCGFLAADFNNCLVLASNFDRSHFSEASFLGARINNSTFVAANLVACNFGASKLLRVDFSAAFLTGAIFSMARIERCRIYATSIWDVELTNASQQALLITPKHKNDISVDNMEVANFIYLLASSEKLRNMIDTITSKVVLILGSFSPPHKQRLDNLRAWLSERNLIPVIFDFEKPASRDTSETIGLLARMAKFVIADLTNPRSIPQELSDIAEKLPSVPVFPIIVHGESPYGMYDHIRKYKSVQPLIEFTDEPNLIECLKAALDKEATQ